MSESVFDPDEWLDEAKDIPASQKLEEYGIAPFGRVLFTAPEWDEIHSDVQAMEEELGGVDALDSVGGLMFAILQRASQFQGYEGGPLAEPVVGRALEMWRSLHEEGDSNDEG